MASVVALYQWHPHELSALLWGIATGVILGWRLHRAWLAVQKTRKEHR